MEDQEQVQIRRRKLAGLRSEGASPYPNDFTPTHGSAALHARFDSLSAEQVEASGERVGVAGRVTALRDFGRTLFADIRDEGDRIQFYVRRDEVPPELFERARALDVGDVVGCCGRLFKTRSGELTIRAEALRLLVKALRPLPEKWHGLQDVERRYRQRYLDLVANPAARELFICRAQIVEHIRSFLRTRGFLEVETPMMQALPGGAAARPFVTHHHALGCDLYLRVAPELFLKRLLVGGFERVFELNRCFRNEGLSTQHNPEFTMLEFYQAYATYEDLMTLTEELFVSLVHQVIGGLRLRFGPHDIDLTPPWERLTLKDAVGRHAGVERAALDDPGRLREIAERHGLDVAGASTGILLLDLFERLVEPRLVQPTFVVAYPVEVSPLARRNEKDPAVTDRFELYIGGRELANAFSELNDPDDQRDRFLAQSRARRGDEPVHPIDEDFLVALEYGMPPAAGEGIGIDRLVMLLTDAASIRDVILFPQLRPERGG